MVSKELKELKKLKGIAFGGALVTESASVIPISGSPTALFGKIPGFVGIGIAGRASDVSFRLITGKRKRKRKKKRGK